MLSSTLRATRALPASSRFLHASSGHHHPGDPHDQAVKAGLRLAHDKQPPSTHYDAASRHGGKKTDHSDLSGNQEGLGFAEQVGSASATGSKAHPRASAGEGKSGEEDSTPPGFVASIKSKLGMSLSSEEVKQNRGGGVGVTGTGSFPFEKTSAQGRRTYRTLAVRAADKPRAFSTSTRTSFPHTTETYSKDVDKSPPSSPKTHVVDNSATGSDVQRPTEPLSGEWSQAGSQTKEYETMSHENPYDLPPSSGPEKDQKMRYGNVPDYESSHGSGSEVSKSSEGPEGESRGGRK